MNTIDRATRLASDAIEYVRDRPTPRIEEFDLADLVDEVGVALQEQGEDADPNLLRNWVNALDGECRVRADRDLLYRVFVNLGRNAFDAGASTVTMQSAERRRLPAGRRQPTTAPACRPTWRPSSSSPSPPAAAPAARASASAIARDLVRAHGGDIALAETGPAGHDLPLHPAVNGALTFRCGRAHSRARHCANS